MGEWTEFNQGHTAPNDGWYLEVGERGFHTSVNNPRKIHLKKGEKFPEPSNDRRKWKKLH